VVDNTPEIKYNSTGNTKIMRIFVYVDFLVVVMTVVLSAVTI